ncbi:DELLA protein RGL1-like [Syzygium oleosum]|uniref:DELLA protein RGL1-like n=1 Tax=Syzygium oleosum TaxID=219896 RepID=UPI0024BAF1C4|nr:DELLA protein RGL1-like [Syzygium oleosum]
MASSAFDSAEHSYCGVEDKLSSSNQSYGSIKGERMQIPFSEGEDWGESGDISSFSYYGVHHNDKTKEQAPFSEYQQREQLQQSFSEYGLLDNLRYDILSPPIQTCLDEIAKFSRISTELQDIIETRKDKPFQFSSTSLELLRSYGSGIKRLSGDGVLEPHTERRKTELSTSEMIRIASAKFIQSSSGAADDLALPGHPYYYYFSCLSKDEIRNVQLAEILLAAAEKVGCQQFDAASELLDQSDELCCSTGNPVERVVYYFSEALREKIDRETGRVSIKGLGKRMALDVDKDKDIMRLSPPFIATHQLVPFSQIQQFPAIQTIMENVAEAKKVHVVDFRIQSGVHWTVLMQALVARRECSLELLKITAVGTCSQQVIEDTGKRLETFARMFNVPFSFKIIMLRDMLELKEDLFDLDEEESIIVYARFLLHTMISRPERLESVMKVIKKLNPCVMVVYEIESNHNSPAFVNRFTEALFYHSAYFDCFEECMERDDENRTVIESLHIAQGIRIILAAEGEERNIRPVKVDVWRAFFSRFGMVEVDLGMASLYQADLMVKKFSCGSSCTLDMNRKCLIIGWKGTPIHSLSAWRFE